MLCYFNNQNIINLSHNTTTSEEIDKMHQVLIGTIRENMAVLVQTDKNGAINTPYTTTMGYYAIEFISEPYTPQEEITCIKKTLLLTKQL